MTAASKDDLRIRLLIVDDEQTIRKLCVTVGEALGFVCLEADSGDSALALLEEQPAHMVLTDMVMPHMSGLEFLERVKKLLPRIEVAVMTGHGSIETAVQAMKLGAYDYITKPFSPLEELRLFLRRMAEKVRLVEENEFLRQRMDSETAVHGIVGSSAKIQDVLRMVARDGDSYTLSKVRTSYTGTLTSSACTCARMGAARSAEFPVARTAQRHHRRLGGRCAGRPWAPPGSGYRGTWNPWRRRSPPSGARSYLPNTRPFRAPPHSANSVGPSSRSR